MGNVQNLSIVFCPTLNFTHRLLSIFFTHGRSLFAGTRITKYIPPLSGFGVSFPEDFEGMAVELRKQESLLAQIHSEMSFGSVVKHREEQLWEAQHIVTQLKRKLRHQPVTASLPVKAEKVVQTLPEDAPSVEPRRAALGIGSSTISTAIVSGRCGAHSHCGTSKRSC